jgi:hypothetical protein
LTGKARIFFPEFNIRLYGKNSESDYFFFLHQNQNIFFSNIGNQNIEIKRTKLTSHSHTPNYEEKEEKEYVIDQLRTHRGIAIYYND